MFFHKALSSYRPSSISKRLLEVVFGACIIAICCLFLLSSVFRPSAQENAIIFGIMGVLILAGTAMFLVLAHVLHNDNEEHDVMVLIVTYCGAFFGAAVMMTSESSLVNGAFTTVNGGEVMLWSSIVLSAIVIGVWLVDGVFGIEKASTYRTSKHTMLATGFVQ